MIETHKPLSLKTEVLLRVSVPRHEGYVSRNPTPCSFFFPLKCCLFCFTTGDDVLPFSTGIAAPLCAIKPFVQ